MTRNTDHYAESLRHLEASKAARLALLDAYDSDQQDRARIAELHQHIGFGLKIAEVQALLAVAVTADRYADLQAERFATGSRLS